MAISHPNYRPPAGAVEVRGQPQWTWNGNSWLYQGKAGTLPRGAPLFGKAGGSHAGWAYDWRTGNWIEPDRGQGQGGLVPVRPQPPIVGPIHPTPPAPPAPPAPPVFQPHHEHHDKEHHMSHPKTLADSLKDHWILPIAGLLASAIPDFIDEPEPPQIPAGLPPHYIAMWTMIYDQNVARYNKRMRAYEKWGAIILGAGGANAVVSAVNQQKQQHHHQGHTLHELKRSA